MASTRSKAQSRDYELSRLIASQRLDAQRTRFGTAENADAQPMETRRRHNLGDGGAMARRMGADS